MNISIEISDAWASAAAGATRTAGVGNEFLIECASGAWPTGDNRGYPLARLVYTV